MRANISGVTLALNNNYLGYTYAMKFKFFGTKRID